MTEHTTKDTMHQVPKVESTMVLRVPKPNIQVAVLGLIALITLFQTSQLIGISTRASSIPVKTAPTAVTTETSGSTGNTDVPQSMVGGC